MLGSYGGCLRVKSGRVELRSGSSRGRVGIVWGPTPCQDPTPPFTLSPQRASTVDFKLGEILDFKFCSNLYPNLVPKLASRLGFKLGGKFGFQVLFQLEPQPYPKILAIVVSVPSKFTGHHDAPFPMNSLEIDRLGYKFTGESIPQGVV